MSWQLWIMTRKKGRPIRAINITGPVLAVALFALYVLVTYLIWTGGR